MEVFVLLSVLLLQLLFKLILILLLKLLEVLEVVFTLKVPEQMLSIYIQQRFQPQQLPPMVEYFIIQELLSPWSVKLSQALIIKLLLAQVVFSML